MNTECESLMSWLLSMRSRALPSADVPCFVGTACMVYLLSGIPKPVALMSGSPNAAGGPGSYQILIANRRAASFVSITREPQVTKITGGSPWPRSSYACA